MFIQIKKFFVKIFRYWQNVFAGRIWPAGRSLETVSRAARSTLCQGAKSNPEKSQKNKGQKKAQPFFQI